MAAPSTLVATAALALGCAGAASNPARPPVAAECPSLPPVYPGREWETLERPACAGWSAEGLSRVRERLAGLPTTGFMAVAAGRVVIAHGDVVAVSYLASVRKSVLSMLYGIYVDRGAIRLDATLAELGIDDVGGLTDEEKQATVGHLLSARSGVYHPASNSGDDLASAPPRGSQPPGRYYLYSNWDFNVLGTIFESTTGKGIYDALEEHLARPLGMQDFDRTSQRKSGDTTRSRHLAYHMYLSTRDMARIGYLMLRAGAWDRVQIVPRDWVERSTRAITPVDEMNPPQRRLGVWGYGYLWWVWDGPRVTDPYRGAFTGLGAVGQHILVVPRLDLVVAHKTRPGQGRGVSHAEFLEVVDLLVQARCGEGCAP